MIITASTHAATPSEASLDLDDCEVLIGQRQASAYKKWRAEMQALSQKGDRQAIVALAGVANNVMACHEEALVPEQGWSMSLSTPGGTTETQSPTGIPDIGKRPGVLADLKQLVDRTHSAGAFDPAYRRISAEWVTKYSSVLQDRLAQAYEDAAGAYQSDCVLKRAIGKRDLQFSCAADRRVLAQLVPLVPADVRAQADKRAAEWAKALNPALPD
ncbi:hypothetical protein AACH06_17135 [Ideonella sp. DXS29W]|uniref:Lipoprotein n=1 Tax=Ideonella lacteola TaxID=2984193 RepID=A0ABU9BTU3_9BURK